MKFSLTRALAVTLALSVTGAVCGAVLGGIALMIDISRGPGPLGLREVAVAFGIGGFWGAIFGVVLAPIFAWLFLRRVSLGRAIAQTALGTIAGLVVGALVEPSASFLFGLGGFAVASVWLRLSNRRAPHDHREAHRTTQ
jgi:hypothetical protein